MFCNKCGNELKEDEKFCGKCGNEIKNNVEQVNNKKENNSKSSSLTKQTIITVSCVVILLAIMAGVVMNVAFNSSGVIQTASSSENTSKEKQEILDVIDKDKLEFKINVETLINAIKEVNDEIEQEERAIFKTPIIICDKKTEVSPKTQKQATVYVLGNNLSSVNSSYPFMIESDTETNNVYRIAVCHPYLNGYGTEVNETAILKNYKILYRALEKIDQDELGKTIYDLQKYAASSTESISSEFNIKGVHIGGFSNGAVNKYGNTTGVYFMYGTK